MSFGRFWGGFASKGRWMWGALAAAIAVASPVWAQETPQPSPPPKAGFRPRVVRDGTLSLGMQGGYGTLFAGTGFADEFNHGWGLAVRVRYRLNEDQAVGVSFEGQHLDAKRDPDNPTDPAWLQDLTTTVEYYQFFRTRKRTPQYLLIGAGLLQTRRHLQDGEIDFPGDGGAITVGAGTEYWWKRTLTFDLSLRYYGYIKGEDSGATSLTHGVRAALGFHYYTSK